MYRTLLAASAFCLVPATAIAQDAQEEATSASEPVVERIDDLIPAMRGDLPYADVFADVFRSSVPEAQFLTIFGQLEGQFGSYLGVDSVEALSPTAARVRFRFERALVGGNVSVQEAEPHAVTGFLLNDIQPVDDDADSLLADIQALPGETNLLITRLGADEPLLAHNTDSQMALGSTFKLYVLSALAQSIAAGERSWDDVVALDQESFPSGMLQDWPEGSPITLHSLATLMISISDNTATDQLMAELGRETVEEEVVATGHSEPSATFPMMFTREMFLLKSGDEADVEAFRAMDEDERRTALAALDGVERDLGQMMAAFTGGPNAIDIEWFASAQDIERLFERIVSANDDTLLGVMGVSPSLNAGAVENWDYVGFKGGSEPGVLNLSWLLRNEAGEWWVVSMGWNNPEASLEQSQFDLLSTRAIGLAAGQ
ncbi:serine hydrolase [Aurantiacibacter sp. D1-12]|uniref:serine hydrolase n=1 Tax=Aurantiacibacter sp. D1-12 TaxID=2993658 RepID=UPI00237C917B|nr:serine hydrolase [Aurantiacibacter sp. D1-12]MDE1466706.1 serine hydrolase [Aurantiacibacter sp. D1-12]